MKTEILSNGSKWAGEPADSIKILLERLASHPLDREFERFGNFIQLAPINLRGEPMTGAGGVCFFGNFATYSHVFNIITDDAALIDTLAAAIRANQQRDDYLDQPPPYDAGLLEIVRKRFSETQGEAELIYAGRSLGQFGDKIEIRNGRWEGHRDVVWHECARKLLSERHAATRAAIKAERRPPPQPAVQTHSGLYLAALNEEAHARTCGYWYTISSHATAHTAFSTRSGLLKWLERCGLEAHGEVPEPGAFAGIPLEGVYRTAMHMDEAAFYALQGQRFRAVSNGEYTLAIATADPDGVRTVHTLNPNVRGRLVFDYATSRALEN